MSKLTKLTSTSFGRRGANVPGPRFAWASRGTILSSLNITRVQYTNGYYWAMGDYNGSCYIFRSSNGTSGWTQFCSFSLSQYDIVCCGIEYGNGQLGPYYYAITSGRSLTNSSTYGYWVFIDTTGVVLNSSFYSRYTQRTGLLDIGQFIIEYGRLFSINETTSGFTAVSLDKYSQNSTSLSITDGRANTPLKCINGAAYGVSTLVFACSYDLLTYSTDGGSSFINVTGTFGGDNVASVVYGASKFVAVSSGGKIATSTNGISWSVVATISDTPTNISFASSTFIINTAQSKIYTSSTGTAWASQPYSNTLYSSASFGGSTSLAMQGSGAGEIFTAV